MYSLLDGYGPNLQELEELLPAAVEAEEEEDAVLDGLEIDGDTVDLDVDAALVVMQANLRALQEKVCIVRISTLMPGCVSPVPRQSNRATT